MELYKFRNDNICKGKRGDYALYYVNGMDAVITVFYNDFEKDDVEPIEEIINVCHGSIGDEWVMDDSLEAIKSFDEKPFTGIGNLKYFL